LDYNIIDLSSNLLLISLILLSLMPSLILILSSSLDNNMAISSIYSIYSHLSSIIYVHLISNSLYPPYHIILSHSLIHLPNIFYPTNLISPYSLSYYLILIYISHLSSKSVILLLYYISHSLYLYLNLKMYHYHILYLYNHLLYSNYLYLPYYQSHILSHDVS